MADFAAVHSRLREILLPYRSEYVITRDDPVGVTLEVPGLEGKPWGYVAGTRVGKRYVSFYLMPVYASAELSDGISPALAKRRQGKSCFNFTTLDEPLFVELEGVAAKGIPGFRRGRGDRCQAVRNAANLEAARTGPGLIAARCAPHDRSAGWSKVSLLLMHRAD